MISRSVAERILESLRERLERAAIVDGVVYRSRAYPLGESQVPAIVVRPSQRTVQPFGDDADRNEFEVAVEFLVAGDPWDREADAIAVPAHAALCADRFDPGPDRLWDDIRLQGVDYQMHPADLTRGALVHTYRVTYLSAAADVTQRLG